jgi:DNA polymerase III delta prime subunit
VKPEPLPPAPSHVKRPLELPRQTLFLSELSTKEQPVPAPFPTLDQMNVRGLLPSDHTDQSVVARLAIKPKKKKGTSSKREFTASSDPFFEIFLNQVKIQLAQDQFKCVQDSSPVDLSMALRDVPKLKEYALEHLFNKKSSKFRLKPLLERLASLPKPTTSGLIDTQLWANKYAPKKTRYVITKYVDSAKAVAEWLKIRFSQLKRASNLQERRSLLKTHKKKKNNEYGDEFDDFIDDGDVDDGLDDDDFCSNILILHGPPGSGKSSSVYAAAEELGAYIFELNPGERRSSKKLLEKLGGMGKSHLVHRDSAGIDATVGESYKQQSIVLLDEVDILFNEDQTFWVGLDKFVETCRRPVILTCENPALLPGAVVANYRENGFVEFAHAKMSIQVDALWLIALCEGYVVEQADLTRLVEHNEYDFRASLNDLQFWCQMEHGSGSVNKESRVVAKLQPGQLFQSSALSGTDCDVKMLEDSIRTLDIEAGPASASEITDKNLPLADWCLYAETLSDADYLKANVFSEFTHDFREEYLDDRILGLAELTELPERPAPFDFELCIYQQLLRYLPHHLSSRHGVPISLTVTRSMDTGPCHNTALRAAMDSLTACNVSILTSNISNLTLDAATTAVVATDISPFVREIARFDKLKENLEEEAAGSSSSAIAGKRGNNRRAVRSALNDMGIVDAKNQRRYLENVDLDCLLETAPAYWANL